MGGACCTSKTDSQATTDDRHDLDQLRPPEGGKRRSLVGGMVRRSRKRLEGWNINDYLPLPPPCLLSLGVGAVGGHYLTWQTFFAVFVVACITFPLVYKVAMKVLGYILKTIIEQFDREIIGVDVHIGSVDISLFYGRLVVNNLKIDNPEGYNKGHLLTADRVIIDLDVQELILSRGLHVVLEELELDWVDATVEFQGKFMTGESNWDTVARFTQTKQEEMAQKHHRLARLATQQMEKIQEQQKKNPPRVTLQKVSVVDVGACIVTQLMESNIVVADIVHRNFSEEVGSNGIQEVFSCLFHSITKSILMGIGGGASERDKKRHSFHGEVPRNASKDSKSSKNE